MTCLIHQVKQHRSTVRGIEAMTLVSSRHFPRHSHDQFGLGMIAFGAQRSWSGVGQIEASAGDIIFCNLGEMHDGIPVDRGTYAVGTLSTSTCFDKSCGRRRDDRQIGDRAASRQFRLSFNAEEIR